MNSLCELALYFVFWIIFLSAYIKFAIDYRKSVGWSPVKNLIKIIVAAE